eukprot:CAMPEP_0201491066 /NCGR_PEP_ID=MMETSP0151_2-20130828/28498_1 /ASSEMBLY_ACC=CAM_ASM_000257 /TAXON_ID=200890 /ORGANISM="Paramoeba atlantica, Strain 621/1 / CCAP 1560/9" /LENGTH=240 /DNA_ID=CAMNT_0047877267 /DNA_START=37 /DNA_END=759 /DNA_ORIENTATION=+
MLGISDDIVLHPSHVNSARANILAKRAEFDQWAKDIIRSSAANRDQHKKSIEMIQVESRSLVEQEKKYRAKAEQLQEILHQEKLEMSQYSDRLEELKSEENSLPPILNTLRNDLSEQTLRLEKEKKALYEEKARQRYKFQEVSKGLDYYRDRLGLEFKKNREEELRFIFTKIDSKDPLRQFSFVISTTPVEGRDQYTLISCNPEFPGSERCIARLNETGNLAKFIFLMRVGFKQLISRSC